MNERWHSGSAPANRTGRRVAGLAWDPLHLEQGLDFRALNPKYVAYGMAALRLARPAGAQKFTEEALQFQERISQKNGLSYSETYLPGSLHLEPPEVNMEAARAEARMVLFGAVEEVLDRTGAHAPHPQFFHHGPVMTRLPSASACLSARQLVSRSAWG